MKLKPFCRATSFKIVPAVTGALGLLLSTAAVANPTYQVYFDGGGSNAGSVVALGGAAELPEGVCGMRVSGADLLYEFYWAEYSEFGLGDPMPEPPWGPPSSATYDFPDEALETVIEFTGPLGDGCEDEWVFHQPLTGDWPTWPNGTPLEAGALVFQVTLPNDIEWLDAGFQVWEPPGEDPGESEDPDPVSICELWPDMCEEPGFTYESPCNSLISDDLCSAAKQIDELTVRAEDLAQIAIVALHTTTQDGSIIHLDKAFVASEMALIESESLRRVELPTSNDHVDAVKAHLGIAEIALRSCLKQVEMAQHKRSAADNSTDRYAGPAAIDLAVAHCASAVDAFVAARDKVRRLSKDSASAK